MEEQDSLPQKHTIDIHHYSLEASMATQRQVSAKTARRLRKFRREFYCEICHKQMRSQSCYVEHTNGKKHQRKLEFIEREQGKNFWCSVCYRKMKTKDNFDNHCNAKGHLKRVHKLRNTIIDIQNENLETCDPNYRQVPTENQGLTIKHETQGEEFAASASDVCRSRNLEQYDQCLVLPDEEIKRKRYSNDVNNSEKEKIVIKLERSKNLKESQQRKENEEKPVKPSLSRDNQEDEI